MSIFPSLKLDLQNRHYLLFKLIEQEDHSLWGTCGETIIADCHFHQLDWICLPLGLKCTCSLNTNAVIFHCEKIKIHSPRERRKKTKSSLGWYMLPHTLYSYHVRYIFLRHHLRYIIICICQWICMHCHYFLWSSISSRRRPELITKCRHEYKYLLHLSTLA